MRTNEVHMRSSQGTKPDRWLLITPYVFQLARKPNCLRSLCVHLLGCHGQRALEQG